MRPTEVPSCRTGNVVEERRPRPPDYWYVRRCIHRNSSSFYRILGKVKLAIREARRGVDRGDGKAAIGPRDFLGTSPVPEQEREWTSELRVRSIQSSRKLRHKREKYDEYFSKGLAQIDRSLRRVATYRSTGVAISAPAPVQSGRDHYQRERKAYREVRSKVPLKECGSKEKKKLKEYALRVVERTNKKVLKINQGFERALTAKPAPPVIPMVNIAGRWAVRHAQDLRESNSPEQNLSNLRANRNWNGPVGKWTPSGLSYAACDEDYDDAYQ